MYKIKIHATCCTSQLSSFPAIGVNIYLHNKYRGIVTFIGSLDKCNKI